MLNSAEHKILYVISINISSNSAFSGSDKPKNLFFLLMNVKVPTIVGILTFIYQEKFRDSMKFFIAFGPGFRSVKLFIPSFK